MYWIGVVLSIIGTAAAIWLLNPSEVLFPGLLTLFSFSVIWTSQYSRVKRENPELLVHRGSTRLLGSDPRCKFVVCISNPGVLAGTLTRIDYQVKGRSVSGLTWSWQYLHPQLALRLAQNPMSYPPVPLLPGSLVVLYTGVELDPAREGTLHLTFKMGAYRERTMKWKLEYLKKVGKARDKEAEENEAA